MILSSFIFGFLISFSFAASAADETSTATLSLAEAIRIAKDYSPEMKGLQAQVLSSQAKVYQALAPYEPTMTLTYNDMPHALSIGEPASTVLQFQEQIGFPGRAFVNRSVLSNTSRALEAQKRAMELQVAANTKAAYYQLSLAQQNLQLNQAQKEAYVRILEITKRRYASGAIPQVDLINSQITLDQNENDANDLGAAEKSARTQLNVILGYPADKEVGVEAFSSKQFPLPTLEEAQKKMVENRNEIKAARYQLEAANASLRLSRMSLLPDFMVTAGMTQYNWGPASPWSSLGGLQPAQQYPTYTYMASVQIMIPLFGFFNERESIRGATNDRANAEANLQIALNQSLVTLKTTLENLRALRARLESNEKHLLPLSEQALSLALISYSAGKVDFQTLADTASARRSIRHDYLAAVASSLTSYSTLGQLMGEEL